MGYVVRLVLFPLVVASLVMSVPACGSETFKTVDVGAIIGSAPSGNTSGDGGDPGREGSGGRSSSAGRGGGSGRGPSGSGGEGGSSGEGGGGPQIGCRSVAADSLPARAEVTRSDDDEAPTTTVTIKRTQLWQDFSALSCANVGCHGGAGDPLSMAPTPFKLTPETFHRRPNLGDQAVERVLSANPARVMPPGTGNGSMRRKNDPYRRLAEQLQAWQRAGFPDQFELEVDLDDPLSEGLPKDPYLLSASFAASLTNIGSCIPDATPPTRVEEMMEKDELFARAQSVDDLPPTLVETDLVSLDSELLARRGVYSFAPTYTLFSDTAGKMRYVRVPVGTAITYRPDLNDFEIPENTRFYKTFLKPVIDAEGNLGWRKMETRLIVSRRDERLPNGTYRHRALRVSYAWDEDEQMARLVTDPLRNGQPFSDRLCSYVTDERVTRDPAQNPTIPYNPACTYMTREQTEDPSTGSVRHYAIPSIERCDQCHMGSSSRSYILGFTPWQADRRPEGEGGVYDKPPTADELGQLERLISYGVVAGIEPGQAKLEDSQGDRKPRNEHELKAQAYMMGNCAFCHNENGFPSVQNPVLRPFDMFPDLAGGGVFQFPLEKYSARAKFGADQVTRIPYITPAFGNSPTARALKVREWSTAEAYPVIDAQDNPPDFDGGFLHFLGPWRSIIWRNVYTPFTYNEDSAIFIHMPRNVPAYDCRVHQIMASWMLSIPSVPKGEGENLDQPVKEVLPGEEGYDDAVAAGTQRVADYLLGVTGQHCPVEDDTVDPTVVNSLVRPNSVGVPQKLKPAPTEDRNLNSPRLSPEMQGSVNDGVPSHAHWVVLDTTDPPGVWSPRRPNWKAVLVDRTIDVSDALDRTIDHILTVHLSAEQEAFGLTPLPMGLWDAECTELSATSPSVAELRAEPPGEISRWFDYDDLPQDGKVHFQSRGQAVFRAICQNCHGADADSRSPLASTILELTGGQTRVANFLDGLFGPRAAPGVYSDETFLINNGATPDEWHARYMLFMALGGTEAVLPEAVLELVATSPFYGVPRKTGGNAVPSPNMLESAGRACARVLDLNNAVLALKGGRLEIEARGQELPFVEKTGHRELWESLCSFQNEPIVRVFDLRVNVLEATGALYRSKDRGGNWVYPADAPIGNQLARIERGILPGNTLPWCVAEDTPEVRMALARFGITEFDYPFCPPELFATAYGTEIHRVQTQPDPKQFNDAFRERWMRRGAMNAGIAAYYFLDRWTKGQITPAPTFDACRN